jgi:hypothetical protein
MNTSFSVWEMRCLISDHQQSWGYEGGSSKEPLSHALLVIADLCRLYINK